MTNDSTTLHNARTADPLVAPTGGGCGKRGRGSGGRASKQTPQTGERKIREIRTEEQVYMSVWRRCAMEREVADIPSP